MISIIVLCHNCLDYTKQCVESIRKNTSNYELILVDNGSTDGTKEWFREQNKRNCEIIDDGCFIFEMNDGVACLFDENLGFAAGNNRGSTIASGDYVVFLNNDTIVTPNWADVLIEHLDDGYNLIGPCTNSIAGLQRKTIETYKDEESLYKSAENLSIENCGNSTDVNWIIGFCLALSTENLEKIGGFDERFLIGNSEDIDFCIRAKELGMTIGIAEDCFIHHFGSATFDKMGNNKFYEDLLIKNHKRLVEKWGDLALVNQV